ncbi:MAG: hypothetical protein L6R28_19855 [Planctomycetes bacterium]|nr:hypothetical protein [Planctomycetota bacterium]
MTRLTCCLPILLAALAAWMPQANGSDADEFKVKREEVFEFAQAPSVTRAGDHVEISFESKGLCDATVVIEDADGRIVRHLASGVLGNNAPPPFQKDARAQKIVWDGKDDSGKYLDEKDALTVRVSLGLKPQFERTLFSNPKRRSSRFPPLLAAAPEGVYVFDGGRALDWVRLFSHDGEYLRTIYPFAAGKIKDVQGLTWREFQQDGAKLPLKPNFSQMSMLTSGDNMQGNVTYRPKEDKFESHSAFPAHYGQEGAAASAMAANNGRIALAHLLVNRLTAAGDTGGLPLTGPKICFEIETKGNANRGEISNVPPRSAALSPDGKTLYLSGYVFAHGVGKASADIVYSDNWDAFHAVMKVDMDKDEKPVVFAGDTKMGANGNGPNQFDTPTCVATDAKGNVYVSDYLNDRVQVFDPSGKLLQSIKTPRPAWVRVHQKTGEVYVFSYAVAVASTPKAKSANLKPVLTAFSAVPEAKKTASYDLPGRTTENFRYGTTFYQYFAEIDSWAEKPTLWLVSDWQRENVITRKLNEQTIVTIYQMDGKKLVVKSDWEKELATTGVSPKLHRLHRTRLNVNPATNELYITEGEAFIGKSFDHAYVFHPDTGKMKIVDFPFDAEDLCFDANGAAYLRNINVAVRYDSKNWREIPWDYGEERASVHTSSSSDRKATSAISGLVLPANGGWHHGGMYVAPNGKFAVTCLYSVSGPQGDAAAANVENSPKWMPRMYPGRACGGRGGGPFIHVWDKHGQLVHEDALPGMADNTYGIGLDKEDGIYLMLAATRILDGKRYYNDLSSTLLKVRPSQAKIVSASGKLEIPLPPELKPKRAPDFENSANGKAWIEGAEWMYGGVGFAGKNAGIGCACMNTRFCFDYLNRSWAPEIDRYSVAVLDANGNLILRFGRYGNVEDGMPLVKDGGPAEPRSIGGDEVALFHGAYLTTQTDKRLYIADPGNERVLSVKIGYQSEGKVALKNVPDTNQ